MSPDNTDKNILVFLGIQLTTLRKNLWESCLLKGGGGVGGGEVYSNKKKIFS